MLRFLILLLFISTSPAFSQISDQKQLLADIREKMPTAFEDSKACTSLLSKYKTIENPEPVLKGYIGGLYIARSKHAPLFDKMEALKKGTTMLEDALEDKPDNIELRFLRLSIQLNLPGFLNYNHKIESDKKFVLKHYGSAPPILKSRIINFVLTSGHFNDTEKAMVKE